MVFIAVEDGASTLKLIEMVLSHKVWLLTITSGSVSELAKYHEQQLWKDAHDEGVSRSLSNSNSNIHSSIDKKE